MTDVREKCRIELHRQLEIHPESGILVLENRTLLGLIEQEFVDKAEGLIQPNLPTILRTCKPSVSCVLISNVKMYLPNFIFSGIV
jgi:hypothetical protein